VAELSLEDWQRRIEGRLPSLFGIELLEIGHGHAAMRLDIRPEFLAPNGYLHAGTVVTLADTCCGFGSLASLPEGVTGFTTIELKSNFLRTAREGAALRCVARLAHGGRTTQVWDATVTREDDGKDLALFRATQYMLQRE
jgi:1,4-dihydroxy-2-naphthoyl-CoA hydrolase